MILTDLTQAHQGGFRTQRYKRTGIPRRYLVPKICEAFKNNDTLEVDFDGMVGLGSTFWEESFGGLVREHEMNPDEVLNTIEFLTENRLLNVCIELSKDFIKEERYRAKSR